MLRSIRDVGQVEDARAGPDAPELREELLLVDALVPGPQVLGVEAQMEPAQPRERAEAAAEILPGVLLGRHADAADVWLGRAVGAGEVEFCDEGLDAEADVDVADVSEGGILGQEVPCDEYVCEAKREGVF